ncbi:hypothetical protein BDW59DRAFT_181626 [Aspergillus cavernicola]|uniref:Phenazine biosynthesis-like protein n=1 Tax=Aspergillus cavernicola TaxID=176166 RepID=A0ABR4HW84_9EURO
MSQKYVSFGNQLAVVKVEHNGLSKEQKQILAREFNFSETIFLHYDDHTQCPRVDIFTPVNEIDFAGHPVIRTGHVLFRQFLQELPIGVGNGQDTQTLVTKAGPVTIRYDGDRQVVSAEIPHNIHTHSKFTPVEMLMTTQPCLQEHSMAGQLQKGYPVVSIIKGVTYALVDFTDFPELFAGVSAGPSPTIELDKGWMPSFTGTMYFQHLGAARTEEITNTTVQDLRIRMIAINLEDPDCGSSSATLAAFLCGRATSL